MPDDAPLGPEAGFGLKGFAERFADLDAGALRSCHGDAYLLVVQGVLSGRPAPGDTVVNRTVPGDLTSPAEIRIFPLRPRQGSSFRFVSVGRVRNNDVWIPDPTVSKIHACFLLEEEGILVVDASSKNGTYLDGARVPERSQGEPVALRPGATLRFGTVHAAFLDAERLAVMLSHRRRLSSTACAPAAP